jgi:hypothetical protein
VQVGLYAFAARRELRRRNVGWSFRPTMVAAKELLRIGAPTAASGVVLTGTLWGCNTLLARSQGGTAEVGLLVVATQLRTLILFAPLATLTLVMPLLTIVANREGLASHLTAVNRALFKALGYAGLAAFVGIVCSPLISVVYANAFQGRMPLVIATAVLALAMVAVHTTTYAFNSLGRTVTDLALMILWSAITLAASFMLRGEGALGITLALTIGYSFTALVAWATLRTAAVRN